MTNTTNTSSKKSYNLRGTLTALDIRPTATGGQMVVTKITNRQGKVYNGLMTAPKAVEKFLATGVAQGAEVFAIANYQGKGNRSVSLSFLGALLPPKSAGQAAA